MDGLFAKLFDLVLSEYGAFVLFLLLALYKTDKDKREVLVRNNSLSDKILEVVERNTSSYVELSSIIKNIEAVRNAKDS